MNIMEVLSIPFVQYALIGGILVGILLSFLSLFIYVNKWSFINIGISHAAFGGLAIGFYFGMNPSLTGSIFAILVGILIGFISKKGKLHEDITIGILLSFSMAFGVILISLSNNYNSDLFAFLFGNILTITKDDIVFISIFTVFTLIFLFKTLDKLLYISFNEEIAYVDGIKTNIYYYSLIAVIAVATVLSIKLVGSILSSAMMILPAAISSQIFWHYKKILAFSIISSVFIIILGIIISFQFNLPSGATIVLVYSIVFFIIILLKRVFKK